MTTQAANFRVVLSGRVPRPLDALDDVPEYPAGLVGHLPPDDELRIAADSLEEMGFDPESGAVHFLRRMGSIRSEMVAARRERLEQTERGERAWEKHKHELLAKWEAERNDLDSADPT